MLVAAGAPLNHVKEQMGYARIQITVDACGSRIPDGREQYVEKLDEEKVRQGPQLRRNLRRKPKIRNRCNLLKCLVAGGRIELPT